MEVKAATSWDLHSGESAGHIWGWAAWWTRPGWGHRVLQVLRQRSGASLRVAGGLQVGTGAPGRGGGGWDAGSSSSAPPPPRTVPKRCSHLPFPSKQHGPGKSTGQSKAHQGLSRGPGLELSLPRVSGCPQR